MDAIEGGRPRVVEPDAIFDRDGVQVWPEVKPRTVFYDVSVDHGLFQFHEPPPTTNPWSGTEERLIHTDPGSAWGWYRDGDGGTSFRRKDKR
jgi:hypothetical protein